MSKREYTPEEKAAYKKKMQAARKRTGAAKPRVSRQVSRPLKRYLQIEDCTQHYILSLVDPYTSYGACIPSSFPLASQKVHIFKRGTMVCGTTGFGFVLTGPNMSNDVNCITATQATSVGGASTTLNAYTNLLTVPNSKSPFANADFTANAVQGRIVSCGLRIRYVGRQDAMNGVVQSLEAPDHQDLNPYTFNSLGGFEQQTRKRPDGDWHYVQYSGPIAPTDIEFVNTPAFFASGAGFLCHSVKGSAGDSYEWELWTNMEFIGTVAVGKTANHVDEQGYGKVLQTVKEVSSKEALAVTQAPGIITKFVNAISAAAPTIYEGAKQIAGIASLDPSSILRQALKGMQSMSHSQTGNRMLAGGGGFLGM